MTFEPLASRLRPQTPSEIAGQKHLLGDGMRLRVLLDTAGLCSMVLWGPPGCGKTTVAKLLCQRANAHVEYLSAVTSGVADIRKAIDNAKKYRQDTIQTVLFVDEVHRFNKSQQDAFLPFVEDGTVHFIGATTENPSFHLNNALLSRVQVFAFQSLDDDALGFIVERALDYLSQQDTPIEMDQSVANMLISLAYGDGRRMINLVEQVESALTDNRVVDVELVKKTVGSQARRFDNKGDYFYDHISALHKSIRGSDPNAALYYFCRMLEGGVQPEYLARRLLRIASEDIGNADIKALGLTLDAWQAYERLGTPEGELALAQAAIYLAVAPKSNAAYVAYKSAIADVKTEGDHDIPLHIRNAPTKLMKDLGYGHYYRYAHDEPYGYAAGENYFPDTRAPGDYYQPTDRGLERKIRDKLAFLKQLDQGRSK